MPQTFGPKGMSLSRGFKGLIAKEFSKMDDKEKAELQADKAAIQAKLNALEKATAMAKTEQPLTRDLDEDDKLRLENLVLRESIMERDKTDARQKFYGRLIGKYGLDTSKYKIAVDASTGKLILTPL